MLDLRFILYYWECPYVSEKKIPLVWQLQTKVYCVGTMPFSSVKQFLTLTHTYKYAAIGL